ncbi:MAG: hypothetical protein OER88_14110, partial [Planctomycetota bacterium]|nr:hypothetical protein [Planctomycetota bacterium]
VDPPDTVVLRVWPQRHGQARQHAWAAEGLALSLIAHVFELVPVDPDRVFLRGDTSVAALAWYIALNNPDRFAGVFTSRGHWADGVRSAPNARGFAAFVLREPGRRPITPFLGELTRVGAEHVVFDRPLTTKSKEDMRSRVQAWMRNVKRAPRAQAITLVGARPTKVRSRWLRMSPRLRSERESSVARRWAYRALSRPGVITATIHKGNLVDVKTDRVTSFEVFVDPVHFDLKKPLRIRVNGRVPESHLIHLEAAHILEDYRRRRDPGLLYGFKVAVSVRDR